MGRVTIYMDDETERRTRKAAESAGRSLSKWISAIVRETTETAWPEGVLQMAGAWPDFPTAEELRRDEPADSGRGNL